MRLPNRFFALAFVSLLAAACGGSSPATVATTPAAPAATTDCPMDVPGTSVTVEDLAAGGAFVFVTTGDVAAVKAHVTAWAEAHNAHHSAMGPLPTGEEAAGGGAHHHHHHEAAPAGGAAADAHAGHGSGGGGGGGGSMATMIGVHSRAAVVDIDGGVRVELVTFPDQIGALRDELRAHAAHLAASGCAHHAGH